MDFQRTMAGRGSGLLGGLDSLDDSGGRRRGELIQDTLSEGSDKSPDRTDRLKRLHHDSCNDKEEIEFFMTELEAMKKYVNAPLIQRRQHGYREDAMEEL